MYEKKLNVDGNLIATCMMGQGISIDTIDGNTLIREELVSKYKNTCDSVVLLQSRDSEFMYAVFEPNAGGKLGAFSQMCGNGVKAAMSVLPGKKIRLRTAAGMFHGTKEGQYIAINVGVFICGGKALQKFTTLDEKTGLATVRAGMSKEIQSYKPTICFGYNVESRQYVGEPHLVIFFVEPLRHEMLQRLARKYAIGIMNQPYLKGEVNITFASFSSFIENECQLNACTFERNLGKTNKRALTGSCGTGAMAAANVFYKHVLKKRQSQINFTLNFPKGRLSVTIKKGLTVLFGKNQYENF